MPLPEQPFGQAAMAEPTRAAAMMKVLTILAVEEGL
jgi:hypothetical protein